MDVTDEEVRYAFFRMIIARRGVPRRVIIGGGGSFKGSFDKMLKERNTQHRTTGAYHPKANGLVERYNQELKKVLREYCQKREGEGLPFQWPEYFRHALYTLRLGIQSSTR